MNAFEILGVPINCSIDIAKAQYRKLASIHHPDKGGNTKYFQNIQSAWALIESGFTVKEASTRPEYSSSKRNTAPILSKTVPVRDSKGKIVKHELNIELTQDQAFEGCTFPFIHNGKIYQHEIRPGVVAGSNRVLFQIEEQIGLNRGTFVIDITILIVNKKSSETEKRQDVEIEVPICALALFTGGRVTVTDHQGAKVIIIINQGHDYSNVLRYTGHGYGTDMNRGDLLIKIKPVFNVPSALNEYELTLLKRLNELV